MAKEKLKKTSALTQAITRRMEERYADIHRYELIESPFLFNSDLFPIELTTCWLVDRSGTGALKIPKADGELDSDQPHPLSESTSENLPVPRPLSFTQQEKFLGLFLEAIDRHHGGRIGPKPSPQAALLLLTDRTAPRAPDVSRDYSYLDQVD